MKYKNYFILTSIIFLIIAIFYNCAVNPVTGKKEIMLIPESQELEMGKSIDKSIRTEYGIYNNQRLNYYVNSIGQKLVLNVHRKNIRYHFSILDSKVVNAFAAPGGYIYITRGLIAMLNSESELATVLGHELGHVNARHSAKSMSRAILFNIGLIIGSELSKEIRKISPLLSIGTQLLFLKYSRKNEYQADLLGIEYARKAGYNPEGLIHFFYSLENLTINTGGYTIPNFLSTHPYTNKRIKRAKTLIYKEDKNLITRRNTYLRNINGIVFGSDPRQGYVENNTFYHPEMKFYFRIPFGWNIINSASQVKLISKDKNTIIILMAEKTNYDIRTYSTEIFKRFESTNILNYGKSFINGFPSYFIDFYINNTDNNGTITQLRSFISSIRKDNFIYTFFVVSEPMNFVFRKRIIFETINSFSRLTNPYFINRKPLRIYIRKVNNNIMLKDFLRRNLIKKNLWKKISIINNIPLNKILNNNTLIKLIK